MLWGFLRSVSIVCALVGAMPAKAVVNYSFTGPTVRFSFDTANLLTDSNYASGRIQVQNTAFSFNTIGYEAILLYDFRRDSIGNRDNRDAIEFISNAGAAQLRDLYVFSDGDFSRFGAYTDVSGRGVLTISDPRAVPELESWLLLVAGLGIVGMRIRSRRLVPAA